MIKENKDGLLFDARVKAGARRFYLSVRDEGVFIDVSAQPKDNKANMEIVKELKHMFRKEVVIVKGASSKDKVILVRGMTKKEFLNI
jgi:uncharacterized protein